MVGIKPRPGYAPLVVVADVPVERLNVVGLHRVDELWEIAGGYAEFLLVVFLLVGHFFLRF